MLALLARQYRKPGTFRTASEDITGSLARLKTMKPDARAELQLVMGHCVLPAIGEFGPGIRSITFLRDPFEQFLSSYHYIRRAPWNRNHELVKKMGGLEEFLHHRVKMGLDNPQVRHLSGVLDAMWVPDTDAQVASPVNEELFHKAKDWLYRMDHVGLTEEFDASVFMMKRGLSWPKHVYYQVHNRTVSRDRSAPDGSLMRAFREVYSWDLRLYALAQERFDRDFRSMGPGFPSEIANFQRMNRALQYANRVVNFLDR
jgi:hypothetical protein